MPFFSIVIPLYNKENYVQKTIKSVLSQTFTDFEILVINDASTDNSLSKAKSVNDSRIKIINHEQNRGLSASRNTGIKNAMSNFIAFLDADDTWKPAFLEKIKWLTEQYPEAGLFATKYEEIYPGNVVIEHPFEVTTGIIDDFFIKSLNQSIYYPSCLCVKKEVFEKAGLYNENITFGEDIDFNIRAHQGAILAYYNEPLVQYTMQSENQITRNGISNKIITDFDSYEGDAAKNSSLKKYLDFQRYVMFRQYRMAGNVEGCLKMKANLNTANLNYKQRLLLQLPAFALKFIRLVKSILIKKGLNPTTY